MKTSKIYVAQAGQGLALTSGKCVAVYPCQKGETHSYVLMESGRMSSLKGARIQGVGVARFLTEHGFTLAEPGNELAAKLADLLDIREGTKLVEDASHKRAIQLQAELGGKKCTYVPFDEEASPKSISVQMSGHFTSTIMDLTSGLCAGAVQIDYDIDNNLPSSLALNTGWIVAPEMDATNLPRNTEYGGTVELAVLTICNSGLGTLVGAQNLVMDELAPETELFPRGKLTVALKNGDSLVVGIDALDEMNAQYVRNGEVIYARTGLTELSLGKVVGAIAAVIVRVNEQDLAMEKAPRKKAA